MNNIKNADFLTTFPSVLKKDESMLALGRLIAEELHITANETEKNIVYANIDTLPETWLDILAYDLHVDWYNYDYPIEAKRAVIKDSVRVHQKLGTKAAVEMALGGIHPQSELEEWFTYGGKPHGFRIVLDTTHSRVEADYEEIVKTVDIYKRLTAHLDGLYYQCSMRVTITPCTEYFLFSASTTGQTKTGTKPNRNTAGAVKNSVININTNTEEYLTEAIRTGTKPDKNIVFSMHDSEIVPESDTKEYRFISKQTGEVATGTTPYISKEGAVRDADVSTMTAGQGHKFLSNLVGTNPERSMEAEMSDKGMTTTAETESYQYTVKYCGTFGLSK